MQRCVLPLLGVRRAPASSASLSVLASRLSSPLPVSGACPSRPASFPPSALLRGPPARGAGTVAWSGKEHSDSMEIEPRQRKPENPDGPDNPSAQLDPLAYHPSGSMSEQIVAGLRSPVDPLKDRQLHSQRQARRGTDSSDDSGRAEESTRMSESSQKRSSKQKEPAPSLEEVDEEADETERTMHTGP